MHLLERALRKLADEWEKRDDTGKRELILLAEKENFVFSCDRLGCSAVELDRIADSVGFKRVWIRSGHKNIDTSMRSSLKRIAGVVAPRYEHLHLPRQSSATEVAGWGTVKNK